MSDDALGILIVVAGLLAFPAVGRWIGLRCAAKGEGSWAGAKPMTGAVRTICAYCKALICDGPLIEGRVSHGCCPACIPKMRASFGLPAKARE